MNPQAIIAQLSRNDRDLLERKGISEIQLLEQLKRFQQGFPPLKLIRPASPGDGVLRLKSPELEEMTALYEQEATEKKICKFVPASGAASRMFRLLFSYLHDEKKLSRAERETVQLFFDRLEDFAFYEDLAKAAEKRGLDLDELREEEQYAEILRLLLTEAGLNYGQLPKLLLRFHRYQGVLRTPAMEHLVEGAHYAIGKDRRVYLHFTVSSEHENRVQAELQKLKIPFSARYAVSFQLETSLQNPSTDTLAVDLAGIPFRSEDGELLFRPGGHGALLDNLNQLDADWVFIKNVDNVVADAYKAPTYRYKKLLGGLLCYYQAQIFAYLRQLDDPKPLDPEFGQTVFTFLQHHMGINFPASTQCDKGFLRRWLNRPIRVCGVIKTDQNTGGGPFWVQSQDSFSSLQIVETAQIQLQDPQQTRIASESGYANITDLVCGLKDYKGKAFDLRQFRDEDTGFITQKSMSGRYLKALELPGLWNGAMADWHTILVEVPHSTFSPVKSVMDLLREEHMGGKVKD